MSLHTPSYIAAEDLTIARVVRATATAEGSLACSMADDNTVEPVGVTQQGSYAAPGIGSDTTTVAALTGKAVNVAGRGHTAMVTVGTGGVTAGSRVKVGAANGTVRDLQGTEAGGTWSVGIARETRAAGEMALIYVDPAPVAVADT